MLTTIRGDICASWDAVNTMLKLQLDSIRVSFQKSVVNIDHRYNTPIYSKLHGFVSRQCIQLIGKELERVKYVVTLEQHMGYHVRSSSSVTRF